jgi:hypothetical protein
MEMEVMNIGEPAFLTRAILSIPTVTPLVRIPPTCQDATDKLNTGAQILVCDFGNPLEGNVMWFLITICFIRLLREVRVSSGVINIARRCQEGSDSVKFTTVGS